MLIDCSIYDRQRRVSHLGFMQRQHRLVQDEPRGHPQERSKLLCHTNVSVSHHPRTRQSTIVVSARRVANAVPGFAHSQVAEPALATTNHGCRIPGSGTVVGSTYHLAAVTGVESMEQYRADHQGYRLHFTPPHRRNSAGPGRLGKQDMTG
jgi:hypothetical protein